MIRAIIDWEYAGFYTENFDARFYHRLGLSVAFERDDDNFEASIDIVDIMSGTLLIFHG